MSIEIELTITGTAEHIDQFSRDLENIKNNVLHALDYNAENERLDIDLDKDSCFIKTCVDICPTSDWIKHLRTLHPELSISCNWREWNVFGAMGFIENDGNTYKVDNIDELYQAIKSYCNSITSDLNNAENSSELAESNNSENSNKPDESDNSENSDKPDESNNSENSNKSANVITNSIESYAASSASHEDSKITVREIWENFYISDNNSPPYLLFTFENDETVCIGICTDRYHAINAEPLPLDSEQIAYCKSMGVEIHEKIR